MILSITVRNFQSLEDVTLELGSVTVVVGQTDSGKSSFLRATQAALFNDSVYDSVTIKNGIPAVEMQVEFRLSDGHSVLWRRSKATAFYELTTPTGEVKTFNKLGRGVVPDDIQKLLGIREVVIDEQTSNRLQFADQHEPPFLVSDRGGVGATRILGRLSGVFVLSNANKLVQADKIKVSGDLDSLERRQKDLIVEKDAYAGVELRKELLDNARVTIQDLIERQNRLREMMRIRALAVGLDYERQQMSFDPGMEQAIISWDLSLQNLWPRIGTHERKVQSLSEQTRIQRDIEAATADIAELELASNFPDVTLDKLESLSRLKTKLTTALVDLTNGKSALGLLAKTVEGVEGSLKDMDDQFPLCPFKDQFSKQQGVYRCQDLMKVLDERTQNIARG